jgi:hypothetical protein
MFSLAKVLHVLAVALWFGAGLFFTFVVGLSLFDTFEKETAVGPKDRPFWLPAPAEPRRPQPGDPAPKELLHEQGVRIAGAAVGPMFLPYYILQVACGALALLTALACWGRGVHNWRVIVLALALAGAGVGWWLEREVEALRGPRDTATEAELTAASPSEEQKQAAAAARAKFGEWHLYSLCANFGTLALVTVAVAMTAFLPPVPGVTAGSSACAGPTPG